MEQEIKSLTLRSFRCDWCKNKHIAKVTVHNKVWYLCKVHLLKYKERFNLSDEEIKKIIERHEKSKYH